MPVRKERIATSGFNAGDREPDRPTMSEVYREDTRDENGSQEGSRHDFDVGIDTDDFVWEDVLEEIGRFENFDLVMRFTQDEWVLNLPSP